ncbi:MAG TPA: hypothetical protein DEF47_01815 [Herpetosiphon sp.]|uniref:DUF7919 domain-containing protein n=1 Tax=Herpetosiphon aurantiacus (strain ATCC 23779 / DSM 785 / 114-95) TaxID=316274 RepID=A9AVH1_HERA2|nr:hypothetical protein [Herpetosiphon sp.]ABX04662.1 conserved hypothetical protein [Herpetosiphon aurantiacus DSM 785]HBW48623.1 hypothetical protein [Herpetosiphon sp.]
MMTWYDDLTPCTYFDLDQPHGDKLLAVGWLERGHPYPKGSIASAVQTKLVSLCENPWEPLAFLGWHACDRCLPDGQPDALHADGMTVPMGSENLFVPGHGLLYVAPSLIVHFIAVHGYQPPPAFCAAVLACPPMGSEDYLQAISSNGPTTFAKWVRETPRKVQ